MSDATLRSAEGLIVTALVVSYILVFVIRRLRRRRPDLQIGAPIFIGVSLRLFAVAGIGATGLQSQLRGGDEETFLRVAHILAGTPWGRGFLPHGPYQLQTVVFAVQLKLGHLSDTSLRVTQIGIAMLGIVLVIAAVHDLAGPGAARLAAWLLAFEPSNLFFNSALHKEPLMLLASGLVVFGGTKVWRRLDLNGGLLVALGDLIAIETRAYAGWFLVSASAVLLLHAALRRLDRPTRAMPVVYGVAIAVFLATPSLVTITSNKSLQTLQQAQNFTTGTQAVAANGASNSDNLALETVNFSTRGAVITGLPRRISDLITRPYLWQLQNPSQQLGAVGTLVALAGFLLLLRYAWLARASALAVVAPFVYPFLFLLVAYSLSAGNAGTGFRYRSHLVVLGAAMLAVLRERVLSARSEAATPPFEPAELAPDALPPTLLPA